MAITRDEIIQAAEALERDGEKATMASVREYLGGGSFATISPVLREWKEGRKTTQAVVLDMPGELKAVMERLGSEFWQAASKLANEKLIAVQAEAESAVTEAHAERDETLQEVARLESSLASFGDKLLTAEKQSEAAKMAQQQTEVELIRLREQLTASQQEVSRLRGDVARVGQEKDRQADDASQLRGLNEELKRALAEARQQAETSRQESTQSALEAGNLKNQLAQSQTTQERQQIALEQLQAETLNLKTSAAELEARLDDRVTKVGQLEAELVAMREKKQEEVQQIANLTAEREAGKTRVRELVQECGELRQENQSVLLVNSKLRSGKNRE